MTARADRVEEVREFNRFYTRQIGVLQEHLHDSKFSLAESRVLYELGHRPFVTATDLADLIKIDLGYLSRLLAKFETDHLVKRQRSTNDGRQLDLSLSSRGKKEFHSLDQSANEAVNKLLENLDEAQQEKLIRSFNSIRAALSGASAPVTLRTHRPGDMGMVVHRHGVLYATEYGWDESFEALVAEITASFVRKFDPAKERCWVAERNGEFLGCVFLVKENESTAKLRLLLVEPGSRGSGVGRRLVRECIEFARQSSYHQVVLWTNDCLHAARKIYQENGFELVKEESHHSFGQDLIGQYWKLALQS